MSAARTKGRTARLRVAAAALAGLFVHAVCASALHAAGDPRKAGAYCPFPKAGEKPACFAPVEKEYSAFFAAADAGTIDDEQMAALERDLDRADGEDGGYLAVSSLAYGYYRLAERAAASDRPDPALVARIEALNGLLSSVYQDPAAPADLRVAVRAAAEDLYERAPAVPVDCDTGAGSEPCVAQSTLLQALKAIDDPSADRGVRGALERLYERVAGDHAPRAGDTPK